MKIPVCLFFAVAVVGASPSTKVYEDILPGRQVFDNPHVGITKWPETLAEARKISASQRREFLLTLGPEHPNGPEAAIGQSRFVVLQEGKVHMLAMIDGGGTIGSIDRAVIHCTESRCTLDGARSEPTENLSDNIISLSDNGVSQLRIINVGRSRELEIVEMGDKGLVRASEKYPEYYRRDVIPNLEAAIVHYMKAIPTRSDPAHQEEIDNWLAATHYSLHRAKLNAGLSDDAFWYLAARWAQSGKRDMEQLAIEALRTEPRAKLAKPVWEAINKRGEEILTEESLNPPDHFLSREPEEIKTVKPGEVKQ